MTTGLLRRALLAAATGLLCIAAPCVAADESLLLPVVIEPANPDAVWLPLVSGPGDEFTASALRRSSDGGTTLAEVLHATFTPASPVDVSVSASGIAYAALERGTIRRSSDGGATWQALPALRDAIDVAVGPPPAETVFAVVSGLVAPTTASTTRRGLRETECEEPVEDDDDAPATRAGVYRLEGGAWRRVLAADVDVVYPHPTDPSVVVAVGYGCGLYRSTDGGATFALVGGQHPPIDGLVFDPSRPGALLWLDGEGGLVVSEDAGATWQRNRTAPRLSWLAQPAADRPNRVIGLVRPAGNDDVLPRRLVVSEDFGRTWRELWRAGTFGVSSVSIAPSDSTRVYATTPWTVLRSDDGGATWSAHGQPLDGHGPAVALAAQTLELRPTLGGRRPASVHVPLVALTPDEHTLGALVRIAFRYGGRLQTAGLGSGLFGARSATLAVPLTRAAIRAIRAEGSVDALVRIRSIDDAGQERVRWEPVTLTG